MRVDSFLVCSNQFSFTVKCNNIKLLPYNFISFCFDGREIFQCSADEYYLDFYKLSDGIAVYILIRRTNEEICNIIDNKSEEILKENEELKEKLNKIKGGRSSISYDLKVKVINLANNGYNQSAIAKEVGISQQSVSRILRDSRSYVLK